ncbi:zinc carboxypeptidase-like [Drosophila busckii]|uniref:zinc carboxypeptidase-like n=1 Tax=Drosophila busckii TaxID=30019 RepID=UPI00083F2FD1|nr:zinc carboxypeptidase-like [Drosophila busckii]
MNTLALKVFAALALILLVESVSEDQKRYDNYSVYKIRHPNQLQRQLLHKLTKQHESFSLWHESREEIHLMVSPQALPELGKYLNKTYARSNMFISNVQELIDNEQALNMKARFGPTVNWKRYNTLSEIEAWLDDILIRYPGVTEGFILGKSFEGRNIRGLKISYKTGNPGVFIESNIHANEWITSASATWMINQLLSSADKQVREMAESHDWYIVPVLNVDGFVYSHEKDRLWRKTRQPSAISSCIGVDPNRNYDSYWMVNGASNDPCEWTYAGPHALSEPEIKAMSDFVSSIKDKLNVMLAFHSYSQLLLSPFGHTDEEVPENYDDLMQVAKAYADAVQALPYGTVYQYGSSAGLLYPASGATLDWAYNEQYIRISYTIEFRDTGKFGFVIPPAYIIPNAEENLIGIVALLAEAKKLGYLKLKY